MNWRIVGIVVGIVVCGFAASCLLGLMLRWRRTTTTFPSRRLTDEEIGR